MYGHQVIGPIHALTKTEVEVLQSEAEALGEQELEVGALEAAAAKAREAEELVEVEKSILMPMTTAMTKLTVGTAATWTSDAFSAMIRLAVTCDASSISAFSHFSHAVGIKQQYFKHTEPGRTDAEGKQSIHVVSRLYTAHQSLHRHGRSGSKFTVLVK